MGNQILFISLRTALLFNDGVGITLWFAVDGKLFTVSLVAMKKERKDKSREKGRDGEWYREQRESTHNLAVRVHVVAVATYMYYTYMYYIEGKKKRRVGARRKSKGNLSCSRIKMP